MDLDTWTNFEFFIKNHMGWSWTLINKLLVRKKLSDARTRCQNFDRSLLSLFSNIKKFCLFSGHPRSGHSVIGTLLNAHRNILISHNLDALEYIKNGFNRDDLYLLIMERDRWLSSRGRKIGGYSYQVPGQYQDYNEKLLVIGDKRARQTSEHFQNYPQLLAKLPEILGMPICLIQHIRNPWDNISSIYLKNDIRRGRSLATIIDWYFKLLEATCATIRTAGNKVHIVQTYHEDLIHDPKTVIAQLLDILGVPGDDSYFQSCRDFVHITPRQTRNNVIWTPSLTDKVAERARNFPELARYQYSE